MVASGATVPQTKADNSKGKKLPPMLEEYLSYKNRYPDHFLFFQVGDFYELFFEDAVQVARLINITLTSRDKKDPNPIPMCGVPIRAIEGYLERILGAGFSAALVSQVTTGEAKTGKGMVERKLERVVTPGVRIMSHVEGDASSKELILAIGMSSESDLSVAWGSAFHPEIQVRERVHLQDLAELLLRLEVAEVIVPKEVAGKRIDRRTSWVKTIENLLGEPALRMRAASSLELLGETDRLSDSSQFSLLSSSGKKAVRAFIRYMDETTVSSELPFLSLNLEGEQGAMVLDSMTRRNLELVETARDKSVQGSLFHYLDNTNTAGGARLLRKWVVAPLTEQRQIEDRLSAVGFFVKNFELRAKLRELLRGVSDLERLRARISLGVASPREFSSLRGTLSLCEEIYDLLTSSAELQSIPLLSSLRESLKIDTDFLGYLMKVLSDDPPVQLSEGNVVRDGYDETVDSLRRISQETNDWLREFEEGERKSTGISSLKVRSNNAIGLYIEVSKNNKDKVPVHYIPRQTLTNGVRFITEELREWEKRLSTASVELKAKESEIFSEVCEKAKEHLSLFLALHSGLAQLDILTGFAKRAEEERLTAPQFIEIEGELFAKEAWHPVLKQILKERCIPNDVALSRDKRCLILTGPNMGGKSTYLRQVGLLVVLAQIGSYVPAAELKLGIFDRVFARLGASDDLHEGESTFMVEMKEAAIISQYASKDSLVLIDELGRGTATADGLSLAKALLEFIVQSLDCACIFATHYHELIELDKQFSSIRNISVKVLEESGEVIFTHEVSDGAANRSYGLEVARLAGLPSQILKRAFELLQQELSKAASTEQEAQQLTLLMQDSPLFSNAADDSEIVSALQSVDPDSLSPRAALELLYELKDLVSKLKE